MFKTTLRFLSLIIVPHPDLPTPDSKSIFHQHRPRAKFGASPDTSNTTMHFTPQLEREDDHAIPPAPSPITPNFTSSTPRKPTRPLSLDLEPISMAAYSEVLSLRRSTLCICPEHCPSPNLSSTDTFWTCPLVPDSAVSSLRTNSIQRSLPKRNSIHIVSEPPSPSPPSHSRVSHLVPQANSQTTTPKRSNVDLADDKASPRHSLRRSKQVVVSTSPGAGNQSAYNTRSYSPRKTSLLASPPSERVSTTRRRNDGNSATHSRLFELELSPILEDAHVVDENFGHAVPTDVCRGDHTMEYDSEMSDSSFGSLLEVQTLGSAKASLHNPYLRSSLTNVNGLTEREPSTGSCVPALTLTSPTPETIQSVVFCDVSSLETQENRAKFPSPSSSIRAISSISRLHDTEISFDDRDYLTVPVKNERMDSADGMYGEDPKTSARRPRSWTKSWGRLSHLLVIPQRLLTPDMNTSQSKRAKGGNAKLIKNQNRGTSAPFAPVAAVDGDGTDNNVRVFGRWNSTTEPYGTRRRFSFGIPTLARRRLARRHDNSKRYSVAF